MTSPKLWMGTSGYAYTAWRGKFYPEKFPVDEMLSFYAGRFSALELNNTFYKMPTAVQFEKWANDVPSKFLFAVKAPGLLTHRKRLKEIGPLLPDFFKTVRVMKGKLGPVLFQLPPNFKKDVPRLEAFLSELPSGVRVAMEFRHTSWFDDDVLNLLKNKKVALCFNDADVEMPFLSTADWGYLRLRKVIYEKGEVQKRVRESQKQKWSEVHVFFKHEDQATGPVLAQEFLSAWNEK